MKKLIIFPVLIILGFAACTNSSNSGDDTITPGEPVAGEWVITYFFDKDHEETNDFNGYTFEFKDNGDLVVTKGSTVTTGSWSRSQSSNKFIISLPATQPLDELSDDWIILTFNDNSIKLKDDNDEHTEELHFEKQ